MKIREHALRGWPALMVVAMAACGTAAPAISQPQQAPSADATAPTPTPAVEPALTDAPAATEAPTATDTPAATEAPTTSLAPEPTTTLATLAPDQQPLVQAEARALLALSEASETTPDSEVADAVTERTLNEVLDRITEPDDFFDAVYASTPEGTLMSSFLFCNTNVFPTESCSASPEMYTEFIDDCEAKGAALIETLVERPNTEWAAATTCLWRPTTEQLEVMREALIKRLNDELAMHQMNATVLPVINELAQARLDHALRAADEPVDGETTPEDAMIEQAFMDQADGYGGACGTRQWWHPHTADIEIDPFSGDIEEQGWQDWASPLRLGTGVGVVNGYAVVVYCVFGAK